MPGNTTNNMQAPSPELATPGGLPANVQPTVPEQGFVNTEAEALQGVLPQGRPVPAQRPAPQGNIEQRFDQILGMYQEERQRRAGLDRQREELNQQYGQRLESLEGQLGRLATMLEGFGGQAPATRDAQPRQQQPAPQSHGQSQRPTSNSSDELLDLRMEVAEMRATSRRDAMLNAMSQEAGIDLSSLREEITFTYLDDDPDGSEQRSIIQRYIDFAQGFGEQSASQRERALTEGMTPGSSPAPPTSSGQPEYDEFLELHDLMQRRTHSLLDMPEEERTRVQTRYNELWDRYGYRVSTEATDGWYSPNRIGRLVRQMQRRMDEFGIPPSVEPEPAQGSGPIQPLR